MDFLWTAFWIRPVGAQKTYMAKLSKSRVQDKAAASSKELLELSFPCSIRCFGDSFVQTLFGVY